VIFTDIFRAGTRRQVPHLPSIKFPCANKNSRANQPSEWGEESRRVEFPEAVLPASWQELARISEKSRNAWTASIFFFFKGSGRGGESSKQNNKNYDIFQTLYFVSCFVFNTKGIYKIRIGLLKTNLSMMYMVVGSCDGDTSSRPINSIIVSLFLFSFFGGTGFELRASCLLGRHSTT
jgi:hypothetical protein